MNFKYITLFTLFYLNANSEGTTILDGNIVPELHEIREYGYTLYKQQMLLNEKWNFTKDLIQTSVDVNQLDLGGIYGDASKKINMEAMTMNLSEEHARNCTQQMLQQFALTYSQISQSLLTCIESKAGKPLMLLLRAQDTLDKELERIALIEKKFSSCQSKNVEERNVCQDELLEASNTEKIRVAKISEQIREAFERADALTVQITNCINHNTNFVSAKLLKVVDNILENCVRQPYE